MTVRDERAAALTRWHRDMGDHFAAVLPRVLDDLEAIDAAHAEPTGVLKVDGDLTEEQLGELRARWRAIWEAERAEQVAAPAKPATRRRTGGTHA